MGNNASTASHGLPHAPPAVIPHSVPRQAPIAIADSFTSLSDLKADLCRAGLESCNLIVGVDLTASNSWTGKVSFNNRNLHDLSGGAASPNPYEQALAAIARTLSDFDDDGLIPAYGFGCSRSTDRSVVSFLPNDAPCEGLPALLASYRELVSHVKLAGPTSFAPIIRRACEITRQSGQYHILLIVADGQVTRSQDATPGVLSPAEQDTIQAITVASGLPLSIIMVGVGDGPWDTMKEFDDALPDRKFDNFQFVCFNEVIAKIRSGRFSGTSFDDAFALAALMEIPQQFRCIVSLGLLGRTFRAPIGERPVAVLDPPSSTQRSHVPTPPVVVPAPPVPTWPNGVAPSSAHVLPHPYAPPPAYAPQPGNGWAGSSTVNNGSTAGGSNAGSTRNTMGTGTHSSRSGATHLSNVDIDESDDPVKVPPHTSSSSASASSVQRDRSAPENECTLCMDRKRDTAIQCGHRFCGECLSNLSECPNCRVPITLRIRLY